MQTMLTLQRSSGQSLVYSLSSKIALCHTMLVKPRLAFNRLAALAMPKLN